MKIASCHRFSNGMKKQQHEGQQQALQQQRQALKEQQP